MSTMNSEVCVDETRAFEAMNSTARYDNGIAEIETSPPPLKRVDSFTLAFVLAFICQAFR